jgi:hypothetical protein
VKTRGVPSGYVEDLNDARTPLADFFSILLETIMKGHWPVKVGRVKFGLHPRRLLSKMQRNYSGV